MAKGSSLCVGMNDPSLADIRCRAVCEKHFDYGIDRKLCRAGAQKAAETDILGSRVYFRFIAGLVRAAQFERDA
jgi:hypothetical protein